MKTLQQLLTMPTKQDHFDQMILWLEGMQVPASKWRRGGVGRSILAVVAAVFYSFSTLITLIAGAGFLETAQGDWLTLLARYAYGVFRTVATFASGTVYVSNAGGGIYTYNPGEFIARNSITKKLYRNVLLFTSNPGDVNLPVGVEAFEQGTASNAGVGEVVELAISAAGVTVTNLAPIVGVDEQLDESLRAECLAKLGALSMMGPRGAYAYAIQSALNAGNPVNVNRWVISPGSSKGVVSVRVASPSGPAAAGDVTAIAARIEQVARPDSVTLDLDTVTTVPYAANLVVWARNLDGVTAVDLLAKVEAALASYSSSYAIGGLRKPPVVSGMIYDESVRGIAQAADPSIFAVDSIGGTDLPLAFGQVAVITSAVDLRIVTTGATS